MKIGILQTGIAPIELVDEYGSYSQMFIQLLHNDKKDFSYEIFEACDGEFPESCYECDGWIVTGSKHGAYEKLPWIYTLSYLIVEINKSKLPLLGVCFGHQIIAHALGGSVEKSDKGWGVGFDTYRIDNKTSYMGHLSETVMLNVMHQDQVVNLPKDATLYASSSFCTNAGFYINDHVLTIQAHPEFKVSFNKELLTLRSTTVIPNESSQPALEDLDNNSDKVESKIFSRVIRDFFLKSV
jgi:GMP synthase-like glutamine amidotransferase